MQNFKYYNKQRNFSMISLPFTITAVVLIVAFFVSKLQYSSTYVIIAIHALMGPLQTAAVILTFVMYLKIDKSTPSIIILYFVALVILGLLNFLGFIIQSLYIAGDHKFLKWLRRREQRLDMKFNLFWFYFISLLSLFTNYKLKMVLFSRLFSFDCFKCQLQGIQKFRIFNIFAFLGLLPETIILYCAWVTLFQFNVSDELFATTLDTIIIYTANIIFSLLAVPKDKQFFKQDLNGFPINKIFNLAEQSFQSTVKIGIQDSNIGYSLDDIIQVNQLAYASTIRQVTHIKAPKEDGHKVGDQCISQENTVTDSNRNTNEVGDQNKQCQQFINIGHLQQINAPRRQNNILMIDQNFSLQSQKADRQVPEGQYTNKFDVQCRVALPQVEVNRNQQLLQQQKQPQELVQYIPIDAKQQEQRVNLTEYLINLQKESKRFKQVHKYDRASESNQQPFTSITMQNEDFQNEERRPKLASQQIQRNNIYRNELQACQQQSYIADNQSLMKFRSEPAGVSKRVKQELPKQIHVEPNSFQNMISRIVSAHHSPKKDLGKQEISAKQNKVSSGFNAPNYKINEDHDEKPVNNKSKQKLKKAINYPICKQSPQKSTSYRISEQNLQVQYQSKQKLNNNREHLKIKKPIEQKQKSVIRQNINNQPIKQTDHQNLIPPQQNQYYDQFLKTQKQIKDVETKQFKRSQPHNMTLFPTMQNQETTLQQQNQGSNHPPNKPNAYIMERLRNKFSGKKNEKGEGRRENSILSRCSIIYKKVKSNESRLSLMTNADRKRKKSSDKWQDFHSEDKRKILSLQKIYLQKLTK